MSSFRDQQRGCLYIVPTPIGNLADMVPRAVDILQTVDLIAAEDTRHSAKLMQHFQIQTPLTAYHDHSDDKKITYIVEQMEQGKNVALISDAGTPLVSDPGYRIVNAARKKSFSVIPIPGACAAIAALSASGLPSDRFSFEGFPPAKSSSRLACFDALAQDPRTLIFYESPHRILESLGDMTRVFGADREAAIARELTKAYETFLLGSLQALVERVSSDANQRRGEIVVILKGYVLPQDDTITISEPAKKLMRQLRAEGLGLKRAAAIAADTFAEKKNRLYQWGLEHFEDH